MVGKEMIVGRPIRLVAVTALGALALGVNPLAAAEQAERVTIHDPYVRATPPGTEVSAGYFELRNEGDDAVVLVGGDAEFAGAVELHDHIDDDGVMRMREMDAVTVEAGSQVTFAPGGRHVMFLGLDVAEPLEPDTRVRYTLKFEDGSTLEVDADVRRAGDHGDGHSGHH